MRIARALVSGVDVWLNTPRRPLEASGTSGMKAAANGALSVSVLDGWFAEAWRDHGWEIGWAIGRGEEYPDGSGDAREAELLYDVLEREVVPLFYAREGMGAAAARLDQADEERDREARAARSTRRAWCGEYTARFYVPAIKLTHKLTDGDLAAAKALTAWKDRVREAWHGVSPSTTSASSRSDEVAVGEPVRVVGARAARRADARRRRGGAVSRAHERRARDRARARSCACRAVGRAGDGAWRFAGEIPDRARAARTRSPRASSRTTRP